MPQISIPDDQHLRVIELRDRLVRVAQELEDLFGHLVQLQSIDAEGKHEILQQVPMLGGQVTLLNSVTSLASDYINRAGEPNGVTHALVAEGDPNFFMAAT